MLRATSTVPIASSMAVPPLAKLNTNQANVPLTSGNSYSLDNLMGDFVSVACDGTGQYVGALTKQPAYFYWSKDNGQNFLQYPSPTDGNTNYIAVASDAPNYIAIAGYDGVYTTSNFGQLFQTATPNGLTNWKAVTVSANASIAYAVYLGSSSSQGKIYISNNYLTSFSVLANAPQTSYSDVATSSTGQYLYAISTSNDFVYIFNNFGASYNIIKGSFGYLSAIATSSSGQYVSMTNGYYGNLYSSSNYGKTWSTSSIADNARLKDVTLSASGEKVAVVADGPAVYVSTNYGKTLTITTSSAQSWTSIACSADGNDLFAVSTQSHLFKSTDSGNTWTPLYYPWWGVASSQSGEIRFASLSGYYDAAVYKTSDNGASWETVSVNNQNYGYFSMACNSNGQYSVIGRQGNAVLVSSDFGSSWTSKAIGDSSVQPLVVTGVAASASGQYITAVTNPTGAIYISSNYGSTFAPVSSPLANFWCTAMSSSGQLQLAGAIYYAFYGNGKTAGGYVYISTNYGSSWKIVPGLPYAMYWAAVTSDAAGVNLAAAQGYGGSIFYSRDSGATWTDSQFIKDNFVAMCQSSSGKILFVAEGGGSGSVFSAGYIYSSFDYGKTWNNTNSPSREWAKIACDETGQYITATVYQGQLYTSPDYGVSWVPQNITVAPVSYPYDNSSDDEILSDGAIAGIVIGSVVGFGLVILLVAVFVFGYTLPCFASSSSKTKDPLLDNQM